MIDLSRLIGVSRPMQELQAKITRLIDRTARGVRPPTVLVQGETGTGKGLVARLLHEASGRARGAFVDVNCAAIPDSLVESELFGHERGAFTDAARAKPGLFQTAHGGTLFLDEVALLPLSVQAKLLTVLEARSVRRLGAIAEEPVDVWVISATNVDLAAEVRARNFREDLYHRLAVMTLRMPALRDRREDIGLLADHFLARVRVDYGLPALTLAPDARERLSAYGWPGNIRELANVIERAALLGESPRLTAAAFSNLPARPSSAVNIGLELPPPAALSTSLYDMRREQLRQVLMANGGNISRAAQTLGTSRNTVRARIRKFGLGPAELGPSGERPAARAPASAPAARGQTGPAVVVPAPSLGRAPAGSGRWNGLVMPDRL